MRARASSIEDGSVMGWTMGVSGAGKSSGDA
jgi:hypothetical protein